MLRRLAIGLAAAGALLEPPFVCDNTQCRVEPRNASAAPICAAGYYTCASCCDEDADCNCDGHGGDAYDHAWRTPKCPEGYYECGDCCDRDADCACDDQCERFRAPSCFRRERGQTNEKKYRPCNSDLPANVDCSLAYHENASKPHGWCPVGYHDCGQQHDCCDWDSDCKCDGAWRTGNFNEHCGDGVGPTGHDGALRDFECSVHKGLDDPPLAGSSWGTLATEAGACCAGPNETAACADGYTVVAGDAPCVFTCCEGAVDNLTTAADVDAEGICWEAHANEGRRPVEWRDCCEAECGDKPADDGDGTSTCRTVYLAGEACSQHFCEAHWGEDWGEEPDREEWFRETTCRPKADAPAACFARPSPRADCVDDACRGMMPGGAAVDRFWDPLDEHTGFTIKEDCYGMHYETPFWERTRIFGPQSRYCADDHTLAGVDFVPGVGACCTNGTSDDAKCVAPAPECFHRSGPQRCDVLLKYFGTMDYDGEHARTPPCDFRGEPYACDGLRCDPASGALYYVREDSWRWWDRLWSWEYKERLGDNACARNWFRADLREQEPWPASRKNRRVGERQRIRACGVVTADGDFFHAQLAGGKAWDEAWLYRDGHYSNTDPHWGHPWDNFWASTRAPRRWRGLDAAPTTASADACARAAAREFHGGCLGTCGKTCAELGHDPVLFEKLKAAVKKWPDKGGGDAIPDACGFASHAAALRWNPHDGFYRILYDPHIVTWITARQIVAWLGVGLIYVVGVAAACCVSQPACLGYAHLQRLRNWVNRQIEDGVGARYCYFVCCGGWLELLCTLPALLRRRPGVVPATIVPIVLVSTLSWQLGAGAAPLFFFLFFGGLLIVFRDEARARYEKFWIVGLWIGGAGLRDQRGRAAAPHGNVPQGGPPGPRREDRLRLF